MPREQGTRLCPVLFLRAVPDHRGKSPRRNPETDPAAGDGVHWVQKEMQAKKKSANFSTPGLVLAVIAKMKLQGAGSGFDAKPTLDLSGSELWPLASKPPRGRKTLQ